MALTARQRAKIDKKKMKRYRVLKRARSALRRINLAKYERISRVGHCTASMNTLAKTTRGVYACSLGLTWRSLAHQTRNADGEV